MKKVLVIGGGGHAKVVISLLKKRDYTILGYLDPQDKGEILGVKYLGTDKELIKLAAQNPDCEAALGLGIMEPSAKRKQLIDALQDMGFQLPAIVSPHAIVNENVRLRAGVVICDGAVIGPGSEVGRGAIINTLASVDHDCLIADYAHIAPGATLCGGVTVGQNSIIGAGATVIQYKHVADNCLIGAGATVVEDCTVAGKYLGCPAKMQRR